LKIKIKLKLKLPFVFVKKTYLKNDYFSDYNLKNLKTKTNNIKQTLARNYMRRTYMNELPGSDC
jgi:hypothetical protein